MLKRQSLQLANRTFTPRLALFCLIAVLMLSGDLLAQPKEATMAAHTIYRTIKVDGLNIFYREAGPADGPTILLLHGLPSSSRMFEPLLTRLADQFHMIAPDYPGFGHSEGCQDPRRCERIPR